MPAREWLAILANDEKLARERGVRAIHGDAPYMRLEPDRVYEICLRSTLHLGRKMETRSLARVSLARVSSVFQPIAWTSDGSRGQQVTTRAIIAADEGFDHAHNFNPEGRVA